MEEAVEGPQEDHPSVGAVHPREHDADDNRRDARGQKEGCYDFLRVLPVDEEAEDKAAEAVREGEGEADRAQLRRREAELLDEEEPVNFSVYGG